ncbi:putative C2H2-type zinc-finger protein [Heracleum sosnowskyi]|uniref:C2H2-type zinc-finger protein n=1 Tax=Heracleum sosnowskyi TaxID=360622 RepID=A0AAD8HZJ2_9APIA|nr:putative C2H2-type zinc-finger protein [Heracleum sosnowskyi]
MERHQCQLCSRSFMNGKALGGHMRSHLFPLPLPPKQIDPHALVQDRESETESRNPTRKRSTRPRKMKVVEVQNSPNSFKKPSSTESVPELEVVSSVCDDTTSHDSFEDEEDVASCLMMMGRDKWKFKSVSLARERYQCETCKKVFGSFQALGGHRTSHKKVKKRLGDEEKSLEEKPRKKIIGNKNVVKKLMHECPVCFKVFGSGQALGGHKRSHFLASSSTSASTTSSPSPTKQLLEENGKNENFGFMSFIDLNLPAPMEYEEDSSPLESLT